MILVCGGAGYIGSHFVYEAIKNEKIVILDNLVTGHKGAIHPKAKFYQGDIKDSDLLDKIFTENDIDVVVHFAASLLVGESMTDPLKYYDNNVYGTQKLLESMNRNNIKKIVFSSTAAVYGNQKIVPIKEDALTNPESTYGETKLSMEKMMKWCDVAHDIKYISFRYFNVAGAHNSSVIGEDHYPETHLVPLILQVPLGKRDKITIFGDDYNTEDGTCIRDYLHVSDLAGAHIKAVEKLRSGSESKLYNLGSGSGFSVLEMVQAARKVTGHPIPSVIGDRRPGDPDSLIASSDKAIKELGWVRKYDDIEKIIESAWNWHRANPSGFVE